MLGWISEIEVEVSERLGRAWGMRSGKREGEARGCVGLPRPVYLVCISDARSTVENLVERARDAQWAPIEDVRIDHGRCHAGMAEELLDGSNVGSAF